MRCSSLAFVIPDVLYSQKKLLYDCSFDVCTGLCSHIFAETSGFLKDVLIKS